jgi:hypothetical protein
VIGVKVFGFEITSVGLFYKAADHVRYIHASKLSVIGITHNKTSFN